MNAIITKLRKLGVELNLVDNKLRASAPNGVLTSELLEEIKQHKASLISYISSVTAKADVISLQPAPLQECYSLSSAARRMYFLYELDKCSLRYNMLQVIKLKGQPDKDRIAGTFNQLLQRHEALRTYFELAEGVPVQRIASDLSLDITLCEGIEDFRKPFDLAVPPLVRVGLVNLPGDENLLMVDMHHIITDGVSQEILIKDFIRLYAGETLPPLKLHYKDYSEWQQRRMASPEMKGHGEFWMSVFKRGVPVLELPADFARTPQQADEGGVCSFALDHASTARLRQLAADNGATMFMVMLAVYNILLGRLGNQEDVVTGTPVTGRTHPDLEHIIGMFVNMLPVRNYPLGALTFEAFLADVKQNVLSCLEHEEYQYEQLTDDLKIDRSLQRNPLFDTVFTYENDDVAVLEIPGLKLSAYDTGHTIAKFDLTLSVKEMTDHLRLNVEYNARLFRQSTIKEFIGCFREIINTVIACPSIRLADIPLLSAEAGSSLLLSLDHSQVGYPSEATVHRLFERQATLHPGRTALAFNGDTMSYAALHAASDRVAAYLRNEGVKPGVIVGLLLERGMEVVVGMLGILKAGGAYLPLDVEYPASRKSYMISDSGMPFLLTARNVTDAGDYGVPVHYMEDGLSFSGALDNTVSAGPSDLCYVIYTSGTTGNPKGVMVGHSQVVRLFFNDAPLFDFNEADVWTMFHSPCFDFSVWEMYGALLHGGRLVIIPRMTARDPQAYLSVLAGEGVTVLNQTPGSFYQLSGLALASGNKDLRLRYVIFGGEALVPPMLRNFHRVYPEVKLINMFGITETTVHVTYKELSASDLEQDVSNIGRPIPTLSVYILDEQLRPVPRGVVGELYVGGAGVAQGYLGKAELTAQRFVAHPFGEGRLYRSGDQGRQLAGGDIEYLGRIDSQVKVRGFRIELGEIESHLSGYEGIQSCVVHTYETDGEKSLAAYYVSADEIDHSGLRQYLSVRLPDYQVPSYYMRLSSLPLTGNGKIDRKALPAPVVDETATFVAAADELESSLVDIWSEVLKTERERISVTRSFFELGGHSLKVTLLANKIQQFFSVTVAVKDIFTHQDIRSLAGHIRTCLRGSYTPIPAASPSPFYPLSSVQRRLHFLYELDRDSLAYNMLQVVRLEGAVELSYLTACFHQLIRRHESLRTAIVSGMQQVLTEVDFAISVYEGSEAAAPDIIRAFHRPFDLSQAPLLRIGLIKLSAGHHLLLMDMHHIITDGISQFLLIGEFMRIYAGDTLPALRLGYKDYAVWQESASRRAMQEQHRSYWKSVFADGVPLLHLPLDYKRPLIKDDKGGVVRFSLSREEVSALQALASRSQSTLFMVMLSLYNVLLSRVCNQDDIVVGTSVSGRYHADLEPLTGMFVNTLPLRHHPRGDQSFLSFLTTVRDHTLESFEHQSYPLEALIEDLSPERDTSRSPLFDVMFDYENIDMTMLAIPGLKVEPYLHEAYASKFDLTLTVSERGDDLQLYFEYAASLFNSSTVHRLITYFKNIVRAVIADNEVLLSAIVMLPEAEEELITQFNDTVYEGPGYLPVTALFRQQVVASPDAIALEYQGAAISYLELDRLSENVAAYLAAAGVGAGDLVGVLLDREPWLIAGILGVLKSGAAYVPVDTDYPANRTAAIFEAAGVKAIITRTAYSGEWNKGIILNLDEAAYLQQEPSSPRFETVPEGDSLAYVIYTSGSSGVPKGVMIRHRSLANYITWAVRRYVGEQPAVFGLHTSIAFDLTVTSLFAPLVSGNRLVLYDSTDSGAVLLEKVLHDNHCTILKMTPSHLKMLAEMNIADPNVLRTLIVGGEQLETRVAAAVHTQFGGLVKIYNEYGPTEATVGCMCYQYNPADDVLNVPIGYPIDNMQLYLLDRYQRAVPAGVEGEVYISGVGIAAGYHGRDDLNAGVFIPNPFCKGAVMYRSYDTAVYQAEYGLIYRGRRDTQIKLRGHRIEPEEIAAQLCRREDVSEAVILLKEAEKEPFLVCYYVAASPLSSTILRAYLRERLPDYMVPDFYVHLTALPLTVNGKLDESALPAHRLEEAAEQHRPVTQVQRELAQIWADVLGAEISQIGTQMNFFDLGGNSMKLLRMVNSINSHFRTTLQVSDIFRFPVIAAIAEHLRGQGDIAPDDADDGLQDMHTTLGILNQTGA